jgi:hypothetical protein
MKRLSVLSILLFLLVAGNAMAQDIRYNFVPGTNFGAYKTYKWVAIKGAEQVDSMLDGQIKSAFNAQLAAKGLTPTEGTADLYVGYQLAITQEKQYNSYTTGTAGWGRAGWYGAGGMSTTTGSTSTILIGQIALDIYDAKAEKIIWRGAASKTIDQKAKPDKQQKNLAKAAQKLLKNYPPPVKN